MTGDDKHSSASHSTLDVIWVLYDRVLRFWPDDPSHRERDRFLMSKGHGPQAFYAVLAAKGLLDPDLLGTFQAFDSPLGNHPDRTLVPGVEIASGSLGHGLPIAVGVATALETRDSSSRVFCLVGDGELDEGSNHEAIAFAGRVGLSRLTAIVVDNQSSSHGWPGGIASRFEIEGWTSAICDGRDHEQIGAALTAPHPDTPSVVVAQVTS